MIIHLILKRIYEKINLIIGFLIPTLVHSFAFHFHLFPKQLSTNFTATGGVISYLTSSGTPSGSKVAGGYTVHTFTSGTSNFVTSGGSKQIEYLIIAGGGGGGGAGGLLQGSLALGSGSFPVVIGNGGAGGTSAGGANGSNSSFNGFTSIGGGAGGYGEQGATTSGNSGGSGGAGGFSDTGYGANGSGTSGQGYSGNLGSGGGAGGIGGSTGGLGITSLISGSSVTYAKGGTYNSNTAGLSNRGDGGGSWEDSNCHGPYAGASGGSGIVIIRYLN